MAPDLHQVDRLVVDTARRLPVSGELFELRDGDGPVVKCIVLASGDGPSKLRLHSANPGYASYVCLGADVRIACKVLWWPRGKFPSAFTRFFPVVCIFSRWKWFYL